jgi:ParB/RepB/Spo0J family partition protein
MAEQYRLKRVSPQKVRFNKQNPRGESEEVIKNDSTFEQLKDSVAQFGVLVPIVVHERGGADGKKYTLVDGERRLRAALATNRKKIPAHVTSSENRMGEIIQAFHIHMLRKQWAPVAIARSFKLIKDELKSSSDLKNDNELLDELRSITSCTNKQLEDLQRGIRYSDEVLKEVNEGKIKWSHLVQNEASFIEQLKVHFPDLLKEYGEEKVREKLVEKARQKIIDTRDLMENMLPIFQRAKSSDEKKCAKLLFKKFIDKLECAPEEIKIDYEKRFPPAKGQLELANDIIKTCESLSPKIEQVQVNQIISFTKEAKILKKTMHDLRSVLSHKLRQITRIID